MKVLLHSSLPSSSSSVYQNPPPTPLHLFSVKHHFSPSDVPGRAGVHPSRGEWQENTHGQVQQVTHTNHSRLTPVSTERACFWRVGGKREYLEQTQRWEEDSKRHIGRAKQEVNPDPPHNQHLCSFSWDHLLPGLSRPVYFYPSTM